VVSWTWTDRPLDGQPLNRPFGWALIRLDGADTAMLHAVDAGSAELMRTGMRVRPRWSGLAGTGITDIACFEPEGADGQDGPAPDLFEGVMMPELYLADALGAVGKPLLRVHTAGSVGGATGIVAASLIQAGVHRRVLAMAFEKQSESNAMWALSITPPFAMPVLAGAGGYFAPHIRSYIRRSGAPTHIGAMVAAKDRRNGARNQYAHLRQADMTMERVLASPMLWDPVRYNETCPSSDGACAVDAHRADHVLRPGSREPAGRRRRRRRALAGRRDH